jgi:hypothetical protein
VRRSGTLVVASLDRLGRGVLNLAHHLESKGAASRVLEPKIDTSRPKERMILTPLCMIIKICGVKLHDQFVHKGLLELIRGRMKRQFSKRAIVSEKSCEGQRINIS